ncbi:NACHT domain-containing protein [Asanoa iriomotensis]|uniref:NACHT N-terminal Helical domain-containing protein n=1 Tax=Asanoa iriomotensis TaxID=234613 RepID=A0ABQ4BWX3_9ACTN|nr:hypothetical protein [Asanoa iriomotensis]GIF55036.1 hypothetical protein Air01nite_11310 [Asanoa iriomotensis]
MAAKLGYADAARLLGGGESTLIKTLDKLTGGLMLGASIALPGVLSWFDAKAEFIRLSHDLVRKASEKRSGLSRYDRTQRFEAAHTVIVIVSFFEALAEADLPFRFADLELTPPEQVTIASGTATTEPIHDLLRSEPPIPLAHCGHDINLAALDGFYRDMSQNLMRFVDRLAVWERLSEGDRADFADRLDVLPDSACRRYSELLGRLGVEFPEVGFWIDLGEHAATRTELRALRAGLSRLEEALAQGSVGNAPDARRASLARAYRAELDLPVVSGGEVPAGLRVPTLGAAYLAQRFRVGAAEPSDKPNDEYWWEQHEVRDDLDEFLVGHLTSSVALTAPLLVLGQPGSGKSVLTKVLAARLPPADFMPVRVSLRDVPAAADLHEQLELAIRKATGERLEWPTLVASARDALPVVLLDGFDELLQAVGVSHTDYLRRVADFQRREAVQGRPVAVLVTSRTAVADRAHVPSGTIVLRLEPFDEPRIDAWLRVWNDTNAESFRAAGVAPLSPTAVLAQRALAEQPLLLLMLAIYDADGNALQKLGADIGEYELYERLLTTFARREIEKHQQGLSDAAMARAVEEELRTLSVVAFAMHNRGNLWITEDELQADLPALFGIPRTPPPGTDLRVPLRAAELMIGRFFFVHRARADTGVDDRRETYEFLHATFGEFLIARFTCQVLDDMAARERVTTMSLAATPVDDDLLHSLLSFTPLTFSTAIPGFVEERMATLDRHALADLTTRLYRAAAESPAARRYGDYRPRRLPDAARYAAYSANLLLLTLCAAGHVSYADLNSTGEHAVSAWCRQALLWRSQLDVDAWGTLVNAIRVQRLWDRRVRVVHLSFFGDEPRDAEPVDPYWTYDLPPGHADRGTTGLTNYDESPEFFLRRAQFECEMVDDVVGHTLEPLARTLDTSVHTFAAWLPDAAPSAAHALLDAWLSPLREETADERRKSYARAAGIATHDWPPWSREQRLGFASLVLDRLATDDHVQPRVVAEVLHRLVGEGDLDLAKERPNHLLRCVLAFFGRDRECDPLLWAIIDATWERIVDADAADHLAIEVLLRVHELGLVPEGGMIGGAVWMVRGGWPGALELRPDLERRLAALDATEAATLTPDHLSDLGAGRDTELVQDVAHMDRGRLG